MIECLSNPDWIKPQMDFLCYLQNIRLNSSEIIDKIFLSITILGEFWLPTLVCAIAYWCIDFRAGIYLFSLESFGILLSNFFKMIACVNRPWIIDNRIHPSELALPFASGYSFPSGHSTKSSTVFGGVAYLMRKNKALCIALICLVCLVGFSRLWLGVHSPQDVICGLLTGAILVFCVSPLIKWAETDRKRYLYLLGLINIVAIVALVYLYCFNTYRLDYVSGKLLVDPQRLKYITIAEYAYALGIINGCFSCRYFCPFEPREMSIKQRVLIGIIGAIGIIFLIKYLFGYIFIHSMHVRFAVPIAFFIGITITLIYPFIFKKMIRKS
jgi:membrane-associated phospholipid phosphatase